MLTWPFRKIARPVSRALEDPETTRLGRCYAAAQTQHPGQSGFRLLEYGPEALLARAAMVDCAERTLDLQYYIYDPDQSGSALIHRIVAAADRGVRVRLLLDDNGLVADRPLASLTAHPNIAVRVFNPFKFRVRWLRIIEYFMDRHRVNRRMHNKILAVDNQLAILGGRNIGDNYFDLSRENNFRDFDVLMAGPLVRDASTAFDDFWNSRWAVPMEMLVSPSITAGELAELLERQSPHSREQGELAEHYRTNRATYVRDVLENPDALNWAAGEVIWDAPEKVRWTTRKTARVVQRLAQALEQCRHELLAEAAYFIPGKRGLKQVRALKKRGVAMTVLTTALEAADEPLVYSAYRRYRNRLLRAGVNIHEYKLYAQPQKGTRRWLRPRSVLSSLHAKVMVLDRQQVCIGSFNLDPRSVLFNTEIVVLLQSRALAEQLSTYLQEDFAPARSWLVQRRRAVRGHLQWVGVQDGKPVTLTREPARNLWQRFRAAFYALFPGLEKFL